MQCPFTAKAYGVNELLCWSRMSTAFFDMTPHCRTSHGVALVSQRSEAHLSRPNSSQSTGRVDPSSTRCFRSIVFKPRRLPMAVDRATIEMENVALDAFCSIVAARTVASIACSIAVVYPIDATSTPASSERGRRGRRVGILLLQLDQPGRRTVA